MAGTGFALHAGWLLSLVVVALAVWRLSPIALLPGAKWSAASPSGRATRWSVTGLLLLVALASRYWASRVAFGEWYAGGEIFDSCVDPLQLIEGEPIHWGGTNYLTYLIYYAVYQIFGFSPAVARMTNAVVFSVSLVVLHHALVPKLGRRVAWFVSGMLLSSSAFVVHSVYATAITFSLLPTAILIFLLARPLTTWSTAVLGPVLVMGLFLYPAAFLTGAPLVLFHAVLCRREWRWRHRLAGLGGLAVAGATAWLVRSWLDGRASRPQFGGGSFVLERFGEALTVILRDTFWHSASWNARNLGAPYLDTAVVGFVAVGIAAGLFGLREEPETRRWLWVALLGFAAAVVLASFAWPYPGVRRVFPAVPLLFLIGGLGARFLWQRRGRKLVVATLAMALALVVARSHAVSLAWPMSGRSEFMTGAREVLSLRDGPPPDLLLVAYPEDQARGQQYRCALMLDAEQRPSFDQIRIIPRAALGKRQDFDSRFLLLAHEIFEPAYLETAFGRPPSESRVRMRTRRPRLRNLVATYEFPAADAHRPAEVGGGTGQSR